MCSASFLAELSVRSPRKSILFITKKIFSGSKYPKIILFCFEKGSTADVQARNRAAGWEGSPSRRAGPGRRES